MNLRFKCVCVGIKRSPSFYFREGLQSLTEVTARMVTMAQNLNKTINTDSKQLQHPEIYQSIHLRWWKVSLFQMCSFSFETPHYNIILHTICFKCLPGCKTIEASKAIASDAPTSCLDALEISLLFCFTLTCNCLLKAMCPLKSALKMGACQISYFAA